MLAEDQGVNVVRALVRLHGFEIHHVAHDRVVLRDTVGAEDVARDAGALEGHPDVVALGHGDVLMADSACVFEPADVEREKLRFGDFARHPDELFLDELMAGDGLVAKLLAEL